MRVLITGGSGFIGSHLADRLLGGGNQVLVIDNFATGRRDNLSPSADLTLVEDTIADAGTVEKVFADFKPQIVVHAAASYKDPENWLEDARTNVAGTANVVRAAQRHAVTRLIYLQTSLCYGLHPVEQPISLAHPILPDGSSYAISKTAGEQYVRLSGLDWISFRLANAYGPRNLSGPLPTFYHRLTADKPCSVMDTRRDFIFIDDLVACILLAVAGKGRSGPYHVCSGKDHSIKELFEATTAALGIVLDQPVAVRPRGADDVFTILMDPSKTGADFGWSAHTPLAEGVSKAIQYYQAHGITETYTHLKGVKG